MKTLAIAFALFLTTASCAQEHFASVQQNGEAEFIDIVTKKLGLATGWTLLNYGCHCGPDSPDDVIWLDDVDNCCRIHDEAYLAAPKKFADCNCRKQPYAYDVTAGVVTCAEKQVNECAKYCCDEDKKFVDCVAGAGPLDKKYAKVDRKTACPLAECRVDEDCDGGYYCDRGICRMYCDPGGEGSAVFSTVCDSPHEPTVDTIEQPIAPAPAGSGSGDY
jgi:hypothetical protein